MWLKSILHVVSGAAAGLVAVALFAAPPKDDAPKSGGFHPIEERSTTVVLQEQKDPRAEQLARDQRELFTRVAELERRPGAAETDAHAIAGVDERTADLALDRQALRDAIEEQIEEHKSAAIDPEWAPRASSILQAELQRRADLAKKGTTVSIDCRSNSCVAHAEFQSYAAAQDAVSYAQGFYPVNCASKVDLGEPPNNPEAPHAVDILFYECAR